jgi:hypothetical protein
MRRGLAASIAQGHGVAADRITCVTVQSGVRSCGGIHGGWSAGLMAGRGHVAIRGVKVFMCVWACVMRSSRQARVSRHHVCGSCVIAQSCNGVRVKVRSRAQSWQSCAVKVRVITCGYHPGHPEHPADPGFMRPHHAGHGTAATACGRDVDVRTRGLRTYVRTCDATWTCGRGRADADLPDVLPQARASANGASRGIRQDDAYCR